MIVNDSLSDGLDMIEVFHDVGKIGWFKTVGWFVILNILNVIFLIIAFGLMLIPYIGIIVAAFLVFSFMRLFNSYSLGLLYRDAHIINKKEIQDEIVVSETKS
ncbi:hypothetical protein [uncultured Methanobrevibacter sp.]|uniref:hypothetical protein n=1 Tax=uncultured Methanobrevibacter sp. TaxID=253161 RepID=UPI002623EF99|nr:hypothetical protein [uncultured Methanobrevibacter sp.]